MCNCLKVVIGAILIVALAGCATSGPTGGEFDKVVLGSGTGRVVIYRTSPYGLAVQPTILVDGRAAGTDQPGGFLACDLTPGQHTLKIDNIAFYAAFGDGTENATVVVKAGSTAYFAANPAISGFINLQAVSEAQGRGDIASLHRVESHC
jgi:hypothetical protein